MNFTWSYLVCKETQLSGSLSNWIAEIIRHFWPLVGQWSIVGYATKSFFQLIRSMTWNFLCYLVVFNLSVFAPVFEPAFDLVDFELGEQRLEEIVRREYCFYSIWEFEQFEQKSKNASENYFGGLRPVVSLFHFIWTKIIFEPSGFTIQHLILINCESGQETFVPWIWSRRGLQISRFEILRGLGVGFSRACRGFGMGLTWVYRWFWMNIWLWFRYEWRMNVHFEPLPSKTVSRFSCLM